MAKLLPISKQITLYDWVDDAKCSRCGKYIPDTEHITQANAIALCALCLKDTHALIETMIDSFEYKPGAKYQWWLNQNHIEKIRNLPK